MHLPYRLARTVCLLTVLSPWALWVFVLAFQAPGDTGKTISSLEIPPPASSSEEATPDWDLGPPVPFTAAEREQHLERLGIKPWHLAGYRGRGIKVAILDTGFRGYRAHLGQALPAQVTVRSFRDDGNLEARDSQHGILCSEVVHTLAPEATLLLANWDPDRQDQFLEAARWAHRQGARIISCSVIMPSWSDGEGGGPFHESLAQIIGTGGLETDILFFASAGNTAQRHWSGLFHDRGDGVHEWQPGQTSNRLTPWGPEQVSVELYWHSGARYDLSVSEETGTVVGQSLALPGPDGPCSAVVHFLPRPAVTYRVQVRLAWGEGGPFHLVALGGTLSSTTARGSISCPADGPAVIAVGAVNSMGQRAPYSSCGPNSRQPKPEFVAVVPFPSLWRNRPFSGTSAAAPQAAGLAALYWSRYPDRTANQVKEALRIWARDLGPPGHDWETGYGLVCLH